MTPYPLNASRYVELQWFMSGKPWPGPLHELAKTKDLDLLKADMEGVQKHTQQYTGPLLRQVLEEYAAQWREGMRNEPKPLRKQGAGRRLANIWIRNYQPRDERG